MIVGVVDGVINVGGGLAVIVGDMTVGDLTTSDDIFFVGESSGVAVKLRKVVC